MRTALVGLAAVAVVLGTSCAEEAAFAAVTPQCAGGAVTSYQVPPNQDAGPFGVSAGPGGTWYADGAVLSRVDYTGSQTFFSIPEASALGWLTWDGHSSSLWFADRSTGRIGTINGRGTVHEFQIPDGVDGPALPQAIVLGPGPQVWFTDQANGRIGDLNRRTGAFTMFAVPHGDPLGLVRAADGDLYFTERDFDMVGRLTQSGDFTEWQLLSGAFPNRLVLGPDGAVWFTELNTGQIGRVLPDGTLIQTPIAGGPVGITVGPDQHVYAALWNSRQLARLSGSGHIQRTWQVPGALQVASSDGRLWLTDPFQNSVASVRIGCGS